MDDRQNRAVNTEEQDFMEVSLLDLAVILVAQRWFIAKVTTAFAVVAIIYALLATPIYKSTIQIMPPASGGGSGAMAMLAASGMGDLVGSLGGSTGDMVVGVTKSTAVLDKVIDANSLLTRKPEGFSLIGSIKGLFSKNENKGQRVAGSDNTKCGGQKKRHHHCLCHRHLSRHGGETG